MLSRVRARVSNKTITDLGQVDTTSDVYNSDTTRKKKQKTKKQKTRERRVHLFGPTEQRAQEVGRGGQEVVGYLARLQIRVDRVAHRVVRVRKTCCVRGERRTSRRDPRCVLSRPDSSTLLTPREKKTRSVVFSLLVLRNTRVYNAYAPPFLKNRITAFRFPRVLNICTFPSTRFPFRSSYVAIVFDRKNPSQGQVE